MNAAPKFQQSNAVRYAIPAGTVKLRCLDCATMIHPLRMRDGSVVDVEAEGELRGQRHTLCGRVRRVGT